MNEAQKYLINAGIDDIIVANESSKDPNDWKYLSDVLGEFHMMASQPNTPADRDDCCPNCVTGKLETMQYCKNCGYESKGVNQ